MAANKWTKEQEDYIRTNCSTQTIRQLAANLNRTFPSVKQKLKTMALQAVPGRVGHPVSKSTVDKPKKTRGPKPKPPAELKLLTFDNINYDLCKVEAGILDMSDICPLYGCTIEEFLLVAKDLRVIRIEVYKKYHKRYVR